MTTQYVLDVETDIVNNIVQREGCSVNSPKLAVQGLHVSSKETPCERLLVRDPSQETHCERFLVRDPLQDSLQETPIKRPLCKRFLARDSLPDTPQERLLLPEPPW